MTENNVPVIEKLETDDDLKHFDGTTVIFAFEQADIHQLDLELDSSVRFVFRNPESTSPP